MHNMPCMRCCTQGGPVHVLQAPAGLQRLHEYHKTTEATTHSTQADADEPQRKKKTSPCDAAAGQSQAVLAASVGNEFA